MNVIYTDGGCMGNPGVGGWAFVIIRNGGGTIMASGGEDETTNNKMELLAAIKALSEASQWKDEEFELYTDSQYLKQGITNWIKKWRVNGWRTTTKQPVKNVDLWKLLDALNSIMKIKWTWTKGHAGNKYNEMCDSMCKSEMMNRRS